VQDAFVLVADEEKKAKLAMQRVLERAALRKVPEETRKVLPDGSTAYMRPLPGGARMYPETDIPSVRITTAMVAEVSAKGIETPEQKLSKLRALLPEDLAQKILRSTHLALFEELVQKYSKEATLIASTLEDTLVSLRREGAEVKETEKAMQELFAQYAKGAFVKAAIPEILKEMAKGKGVEDTVKQLGLQKTTGKELERIVREEGTMQKIMSKYRLRVDAGEVAKLTGKK